MADRDLLGSDIESSGVDTLGGCCEACANNAQCVGWSYVHESKTCWLKSSLPLSTVKTNVSSGAKMPLRLLRPPL